MHVCVGVTNFVAAPIKLLESNHVHDKLNVNVRELFLVHNPSAHAIAISPDYKSEV